MKTWPPGTSTRRACSAKVAKKRRTLLFGQDSEPRQRAADAAVEGGRDPPHATAALAEFLFLGGGVLLESVEWVGHDGVNGLRGAGFHPFEAVAEVEGVGRAL